MRKYRAGEVNGNVMATAEKKYSIGSFSLSAAEKMECTPHYRTSLYCLTILCAKYPVFGLSYWIYSQQRLLAVVERFHSTPEKTKKITFTNVCKNETATYLQIIRHRVGVNHANAFPICVALIQSLLTFL